MPVCARLEGSWFTAWHIVLLCPSCLQVSRAGIHHIALSPREQVPSVDAKMSGKELAFSGPWAQQMTKAEPTQYYGPLETEPYSELMYSLGLRVCVCVCLLAPQDVLI